MARTAVYRYGDQDQLNVTAVAGDVGVAGSIVPFGAKLAITTADVTAAGQRVALATTGVWEINAAAGGVTLARGAVVSVNASGEVVGTAGTKIGYAVKAAVPADTTVEVFVKSFEAV